VDVFHYFPGEEAELEQIEKFQVLKLSKPDTYASVIANAMELDFQVVAECY
jgi:hypothetical protein